MTKTILITGATDGLGLATAKALAAENYDLLLHGRNSKKIDTVRGELERIGGEGKVSSFTADLSVASEVVELASAIKAENLKLDVLINNAGVFQVSKPVTSSGLDIRFMVNSIAPFLLTKSLLSIMHEDARVLNLSSAAQAPVEVEALVGRKQLDGSNAYAQSKLALTMWSKHLAEEIGTDGPAIIAVNPGSFLGTKMVREAYGHEGKDISIGVEALCRLATSQEFANSTGRYYDNDSGRFSSPHPDANDQSKNELIVTQIEALIEGLLTERES